MNELSFAARQAAADLSQALRPPELAEQHRHELIPARESPRMALGAGLAHEPLELASRKELEKWRRLYPNLWERLLEICPLKTIDPLETSPKGTTR